MTSLTTYLTVAAGTALGSVCRYALSSWAIATLGNYFPWGTLAVNAAGSCLMVWLSVMVTYHARWRWAPLQPLLMAGFCGGFSTFSLFSLEILYLIQQQDAWLALVYGGVSVTLWLLGAVAGERMARPFLGAQ
ncbi:fluoride efflux transporter FluC [Vreelandella sp. GE22]